MAIKFYAVKQGRVPGVYTDWSACRQQVDGFSHATYKSFADRESAEKYLGQEQTAESELSANTTEAVVYTDGSYSPTYGFATYGLVILHHGKELQLSGSLTPKESLMNNVSGELAAVCKALLYCMDHNVSSVRIFHDYVGISKWCKREWQAKLPETRAYRNFYDVASRFVRIEFQKVQAHAGVHYNEIADQLAKAVFTKHI